MDLSAIQSSLRERKLDGWLFYDHHHRDPIAYRVLGLPEKLHVTRRWFYVVPASGEPNKLVHRIESLRLDSLPGAKSEYSTWQELDSKLEAVQVQLALLREIDAKLDGLLDLVHHPVRRVGAAARRRTATRPGRRGPVLA